ncbi:MAG: Zn-dependent hydrolase [Lawsonibacter sp.]|jgi:allantoate deiminase
MELEAITQRIQRQLEELRQFTATPGQGVTRFPFTPQAKAASDYLAQRMEEVGLKVWMDNSGSIIGRLEGEVPDTVMIGSHLDSVQNGGAYDGIAGVVCAIETLRLYQQQGARPYYSLEVIATNDEEGSRFKSGLFTGKVLGGQLTVEDIRRYQDKDGISVYQAMEDYGLKPQEIASHPRTDLKGFLEIHIEQGPVLETEGKDLGIVDIIVGIQRVLVTVHGRADHVGTMPMNMRMDAVEAAAKVIANIGDRARQYPMAVATVGNLQVEPNIINIIPDQVTFSVDFRGASTQVIQEQYEGLKKDLDEVTGRFHMTYEMEETLWVEPVEMDARLRDYIQDSCRNREYTHMHMVSGAGHDAQVFGARMPAAMLFVPSIGGRSHCPEEKSDERVLAMACAVACDVLVRIGEERQL